MESIIFVGVIIACVITLLICILKRRPDLIVNFILRSSFGAAGICVLDFILNSMGYGMTVGVNGVTVLANGLLGLPGFLLLYGLSFYYTFGT